MVGWLAFGTGEGLLWYGICVPCSKRLPGVRDAFSEAFGVKNRLLRYGRDIRCQKQPSLVRDASSKAHRTAPATSNASPKARRTAPAAPNAYSEACRAKSSLLPHQTHLQCAKLTPLGCEQLLTCSNEKWSSATCASTKLRKNQMT